MNLRNFSDIIWWKLRLNDLKKIRLEDSRKKISP